MALIMDNNNYPLQFVNWLDKIPFDILCLIGSSLSGYDAFSFAESVSQEIMKSERKFWSILGMKRLNKTTVVFSKPKLGYYDLIIDYIVQLSSGRYYSRFIYNGFTSERLMSVMNCCQSQSFQAYCRFLSYTCHFMCFQMPVLSFFNYSFFYSSRSLTSIEMDLFRICRHGHLTEGSIVVQDLDSFINNLNNRFSFSSIKNWINFSSFVIAGGAVLNCLLIEGFDSSLQDLDVFWLGGSWNSFLNEINNFKQRAHASILTEKNYYGKLIEFQLYIDQDHIIKIQFIFGREEMNLSFLLYTFDLDVVQVAFDGTKIISTLGFCQAIATKTFICYRLTNDIRDAPLYVDRCLKYNIRGFIWLCPMFYDQILVQKPLISAKKVIDYGFQDFYFNVDVFDMQHAFLCYNFFKR
ncbi:unnamed protein product [Rotaria sp. Silwood2]|nr:unnamed protein product [Rotaria sp. Silwood2]CAF2989938.1 unnamed protein product [Rotaria sp. Silwood2]CAF3366040.1 unnamed protein product [Rotaria sp. Silwood2]CAF4263470.1 unnamed protein product [Rotaria sp. Silwood2]